MAPIDRNATPTFTQRFSRALNPPSNSGALRSGRQAYLFILPGFVIYALFVLLPIFSTVRYSFFDWTGFSPPTYIGFDNYPN